MEKNKETEQTAASRIGKLEDERIAYHTLFGGIARFDDIIDDTMRSRLELADGILRQFFVTARQTLDAQALREAVLAGAEADGMSREHLDTHLVVAAPKGVQR